VRLRTRTSHSARNSLGGLVSRSGESWISTSLHSVVVAADKLAVAQRTKKKPRRPRRSGTKKYCPVDQKPEACSRSEARSCCGLEAASFCILSVSFLLREKLLCGPSIAGVIVDFSFSRHSREKLSRGALSRITARLCLYYPF